MTVLGRLMLARCAYDLGSKNISSAIDQTDVTAERYCNLRVQAEMQAVYDALDVQALGEAGSRPQGIGFDEWEDDHTREDVMRLFDAAIDARTPASVNVHADTERAP